MENSHLKWHLGFSRKKAWILTLQNIWWNIYHINTSVINRSFCTKVETGLRSRHLSQNSCSTSKLGYLGQAASPPWASVSSFTNVLLWSEAYKIHSLALDTCNCYLLLLFLYSYLYFFIIATKTARPLKYRGKKKKTNRNYQEL